MKAFFADLDNTLIYSYKRDIGSDKVCVEHYQGREISYMTSWSWELLSQISSKISVIPITTRSVEQYQRIKSLSETAPRQALVCNGGVLLSGGQSDQDWYECSVNQTADTLEVRRDAMAILMEDENRCLDVRHISGLFVFTKSSNPEKTMAELRKRLDTDTVQVLNNGVKIYVVPSALDKRTAMKRMCRKLGIDYAMAAGDSLFDVSMLALADLACIPEDLAEAVSIRHEININSERIVIPSEKLFSDGVLEVINSRI